MEKRGIGEKEKKRHPSSVREKKAVESERDSRRGKLLNIKSMNRREWGAEYLKPISFPLILIISMIYNHRYLKQQK